MNNNGEWKQAHKDELFLRVRCDECSREIRPAAWYWQADDDGLNMNFHPKCAEKMGIELPDRKAVAK